MAWADRLANWVDGMLQRVPAVDDFFERNFHAIGMHGPEVRHLLKTRFVPAAALLLAVLGALVLMALVRRTTKGSAHRSRGAPPGGQEPHIGPEVRFRR